MAMKIGCKVVPNCNFRAAIGAINAAASRVYKRLETIAVVGRERYREEIDFRLSGESVLRATYGHTREAESAEKEKGVESANFPRNDGRKKKAQAATVKQSATSCNQCVSLGGTVASFFVARVFNGQLRGII